MMTTWFSFLERNEMVDPNSHPSASCSDDGYCALSSRSDLRQANYCLAGEAYAGSRHGGAARERANGVPNRSGRSLQDPLVDVVQRRHAAIV